MQECPLKRDNFGCILRHCDVLTRVSMAKTCRFMRAYLNKSSLLRDWSELSVCDRMILAIKTHSNYNFVKIPSYGNNGFLNYLLLTSIKYENLEIIDLIIQDHLSRHKEWVFYYPKVLYRIGRS